MMPRRLDGHEAQRALRCFDIAAESPDPFDFHPTDGAFSRLATMGPFYPRRTEWRAVSSAADCRSVLLANLTLDGGVFRGNCWEIGLDAYPFDDLKDDERWNGIGSNAIANPDGSWIVVVSNEGHGVVSGPRAFVTEVLGHLSDREDLAGLIERLFIGRPEKSEVDVKLIGMVARLYGREEAKLAIQRSGIDPGVVG